MLSREAVLVPLIVAVGVDPAKIATELVPDVPAPQLFEGVAVIKHEPTVPQKKTFIEEPEPLQEQEPEQFHEYDVAPLADAV